MQNPYYYTTVNIGFDKPGTFSIYLKEGGVLHSRGYGTEEQADAVILSLLYDMENPS